MTKRFFPLFCAALLFLRGPAGLAEETGVTEKQIVIGSSLALSGHAGYLGEQFREGASAYFEDVNRKGGIGGRKIKVIWEDDGYNPQQTILLTRKLIEEKKVFCLFNFVGSACAISILPVLSSEKVPLVGVLSGAHFIREPLKRYVFNVRSSYYEEIRDAVGHAVKDLGVKKVAVFYQYDAYGVDGLRGVEIALEEHGLSPVASESYPRGSLDIENALAKIRASGAEMVVMAGVYGPCSKFILEGKKSGFRPLYYNVSFVGPEKLIEVLGPEGQDEILTLAVPPVTESEATAGNPSDGIGEYKRILKQYAAAASPSTISFEGFLNAKVLVEGLRRCGPEVTRTNLMNALESIKDLDLGIGTNLSFSPTDHQGLKKVYPVRIDKGVMVLITRWGDLKKDGSKR